MNKLLNTFIIFFAITIPSLWAACPKGVESGKTIIFLDLNDNPKEIVSARKAACKRGESLIVMPEKGDDFDVDKFDQLLTKLEKGGVSVNSFVLSGHDGGGQFGGSNGFFSKSILADLMEKHPQIQQSVSSVLLLGCYTGVKQEVFDWKQILPKVNLIAGYEGQAPLGDKPAGHSYIEGVLAREKEMNEAKSKAELEKILKKGIKHISSISAALYVKPEMCAPGTTHESGFYFRPLKGREALQDFVTRECILEKEGKAPEMLDKYMAYYRGDKEIPTVTHGTELRAIYNYFREKGHCFEGDKNFPSADKVLFTLFFDGVKKNFAFFYEKNLDEVYDQVENLKENFDTRYDDYITRTENLNEILKERLNNEPSTFGEEYKDVTREWNALSLDLFSKYPNNFGSYDGKIDDLTVLSSEDLEKYNRMNALSSYYQLLDNVTFSMGGRDSADSPFDPKIFKDVIASNSQLIAQKIENKEKLREKVMNFKPMTKEFIENASRAQILAKAHETYKMQEMEVFNENVPTSKFMSLVEIHLVQLEGIPFEWHEFNESSRAAEPDFLSIVI